jgi:hypothetical protein
LHAVRSLPPLLALSLTLAACSAPPLAAERYLGRVTLSDSIEGGELAVTGAFRSLAAGEAAPDFPHPLDQCTVSEGFGREPWRPRISAGGTLHVQHPDGAPFADLEEVDTTGGPLYGYYSVEPLDPLPPGGLTLHVAGGLFAGHDGARFPAAPAPLAVIAPAAGSAATASTSFAWVPAGLDAVLIAGLGDIPGGSTLSFACYARDDGNFALPQGTRDELAARGFTSVRILRFGAVEASTYSRGDTRLFLITRTIRPG